MTGQLRVLHVLKPEYSCRYLYQGQDSAGIGDLRRKFGSWSGGRHQHTGTADHLTSPDSSLGRVVLRRGLGGLSALCPASISSLSEKAHCHVRGLFKALATHLSSHVTEVREPANWVQESGTSQTHKSPSWDVPFQATGAHNAGTENCSLIIMEVVTSRLRPWDGVKRAWKAKLPRTHFYPTRS